MIAIMKLLLFIVFVASVATQKRDPDAIIYPEDDHIHVNPRMNFHNHHHHHHHEDIDNRSDNDEKIEETKSNSNDDNNEIPLSFIQKLNEIDNLPDLRLYLDGQDMLTDIGGIANRFGERNAAIMPKPAKCIPTLQTVELKNSSDVSLFFFPSCTRVERCGGCCSHSLLSCQPVQTETIAFQVVVSQYTGGNKLSVRGKEVIFVEKHTKCRCDCTKKKEDCNSFQEYRKDECRCACTNMDEKKKCFKLNETKLWDPDVCKCLCRTIDDCTTGSYFDQNKCACTSIPVRRRFAELGSDTERNFSDTESYDVDSLDVAPLQEEKTEQNTEDKTEQNTEEKYAG